MSNTNTLVCSECHEPAVGKPPRGWITREWEPAPRYSHTDGEALCAVMTTDGYRTAEPIHLTPGREA